MEAAMAAPARPADSYAPLYLLASVGAGGLTVSFFMWLMFWIPHPGRTVPVFEDIAAAFAAGGLPVQGMIALALAGIAVTGAMNLRALGWNLARLAAWRHGEGHARLRASNAETQLLALPLALAMSVNVGFILGLVFVPGLWGVVEYLFPPAMLAFLAIGALALRQIGAFLGRVLTTRGFSCTANNSFAQVLPAFALAMTGVGLSAPAAMSANPAVVGASVVLSGFFLVGAILIAAAALVLGLRSLLENGAGIETAPTLTIFVPLLTVLGILMLRQTHGLSTHFDGAGGGAERLVFLSRMLSAQVLFLLLGVAVMARLGYAGRFLFGAEASAGSYALVCPGVGLSVMVHFWLNRGLVDAGLVAKFSAAYWTVSAVAVAIQIATIGLLLLINRKHFGRPRLQPAVPAA